MAKAQNIRDLIPTGDRHRFDPEALRQKWEAELHPEADPVEHLVKSVMSGDEDYQAHPAYLPPNPWMDKAGWSFSKLKRMMESGQVPDSQYQVAMRALSILADGSPFLPPGVRPEEPPPDLPVGVYEPPVWDGDPHRTDDTDVFDPSGQSYATKSDNPAPSFVRSGFNATVVQSDD